MAESISDEQLVETEIAPEEMVPKSRVNEIVKREKGLAADKVRREMEAQLAQEVERLKSAQPVPGDSSASSADLESKFDRMFEDRVKRFQEEEQKRAEEAQVAQQKAELEKSALRYIEKVNAGKGNIADFDEVMKDFDVQAFSGLALLAGQMDNTAEIMYELAQNPNKAAELDALAERSPMMAMKQLERLSQSISKNQQAITETVTPQPPLSRLKSSTVAGVDNGQMGVRDYRKQDYLRV